MRRMTFLMFAGSAVLAGACPPAAPSGCLEACAVAELCGILPSTLGGAPGDSASDAADSCLTLCLFGEQTPEVSKVLECLSPYAEIAACDVGSCLEVVGCLRATLPAETVGAPEVTFRLIDGAAWTLLFQPELCDDIPPELASFPEDQRAELCSGEFDPCAPDSPGVTSGLRQPLCTGTDCNPDSLGANCDPRLCDLDPSPSFDCAQFGIETVQFGYFDESEVLHLDTAVYTCAEASEGRVVPNISSRVIFPVARFSGKITSRLLYVLGAPINAVDNEFCWLSHPSYPLTAGWLVHAGRTSIPVPSPSSAQIGAALSGDPQLFPRGCNCLIDGLGCEDPDVNANCGNELDDDLDGLFDADDPGCAP